MTTVSVSEAQAKLFELLRRVSRGEQIVITQEGVPIAILTSFPSQETENIEGAIDRIKRSRRGRALRGLKIRELIDEGRV